MIWIKNVLRTAWERSQYPRLEREARAELEQFFQNEHRDQLEQGSVVPKARRAAEACRQGLAHDRLGPSLPRVQQQARLAAQDYAHTLRYGTPRQREVLQVVGMQRIEEIFKREFRAILPRKGRG
ncbi:hypothetical protein [Ktedonospora formicarum]|uniref:Uncharacterized protein n=1 Tax=Ktedonospora formicarum TaxID=2778364 RepID=A0A8J3MXG8_9CHLR|nr:hypothetical protein [Ktedonospora formicarum]GHO51415.1 hypothetical protein KSX_95780 [Ktedonospora formicarum]